MNSGRDSRFLSPGGWTAAYRSSAVPASGRTSRMPGVSATPSGTRATWSNGASRTASWISAALDRVRAAGGDDAAEDADAVHPLGEVGARGEHVGAAAGQADQPAGVDGQRVEKQLEVAGPVADPAVEVRRRRTDAGPVDTDDADAVLVGVPPGLERDLAAGAGRAVHPDDRGAARRAVLGEAEPAAVAHRDGALEGGALDVGHAAKCPRGGQRGSTARLRDSGRRTIAGSTTFVRVGRARRAAVPSPTTRGPSTRSTHDDGDVVAAAGVQRELGEGRRGVLVLLRRQHLGDHGVRHEVGEPVAAQQQPVADRHVEAHDVGAAALGVAVDRAQHDVAPRVRGAVLGSELAGVDQVLDVGVVLGDLAQRSRRGAGSRGSRRRGRARPSRPSVTSIVSVVAMPSRSRSRWTPDPDPGRRGGVRLGEHPLRGLPEPPERDRAGGVGRGGGRDLTRGRSTDAVGDQRDVGPDEARVLVVRAHPPDVTHPCARESQHHDSFRRPRPEMGVLEEVHPVVLTAVNHLRGTRTGRDGPTSLRP